MPSANPFSVSYLTEAALTVDELLARYSFLPFRHIGDQIARPTNVFLIGRKGVGKTMLLKVFDTEIMARLFTQPPNEEWVLDLIPPAAVGVYFNLGSPTARVNLFQGSLNTSNWWRRAYADYLNVILLDQALEAMVTMSSVKHWRLMNGATTSDPTHEPRFVEELLKELAQESSQYEGIETIEDLRVHLRLRSQSWARFVNMDPRSETPPNAVAPFGAPLFAFLRAVRTARLFGKPFRLFVLIDQYEYLYQHRRNIDFRPVFNEAIYLSSRGGTGVEFKIGTRQYAYREFGLANSHAHIEINREIIEVDVDRLAGAFYVQFATDVWRKRLSAVPSDHIRPSASIRVATLLPAFSPLEEANRYVSDNSLDRSKHLNPFARRWQHFGISENDTGAVLDRPTVRDAEPLISTLTCIALTRWIRDGEKGAPLGFGPPIQYTRRAEQLKQYTDRLIGAIGTRYELLGTAARKTKALRTIDNFVHDTEEAALFQIASAYKNQKKYYSGFKTIVKLSSNVALVLIELLREAYEYLPLEGVDPLSEPIPPELQSAAVYSVSEAMFRQITHDCDYGETFYRFLLHLGGCLRELQLELTVPQPSPNGFSLGAFSATFSSNRSGDDDPRTTPSVLISEAVSWGLLEESEHQSKKRIPPKRRKYRLNRAYCPYFGLSEMWRKDPIYVDDVDAFVEALLQQKPPKVFHQMLDRARGGRKASEPSGLFRLMR